MDNLIKSIGIRHVGYVVPNRDVAVKRLKEFYGIEDWIYIEYKPLRASCYGKTFNGYYVRAAAMPASGSCALEIIEPVSEGMHMDFLRKYTNCINHICHTVKEYEKYRDHFIDLGCELIFEAEMEDDIKGYRRCAYAYDPVMNTIFEFAEEPYFRNKISKEC
ncbi:MAG: VOC family protein [Acetivibrionales bacterium]|jgi:hypothetical protein